MTDLLADTIAKLENATGPDREIDNAIWAILGQPLPDDPVGCPPRYTESIDAALTLVPDGWAYSIHGGDGVCAGASLSKLSEEDDPFIVDLEIEGNEPPYTVLCLCLAAMRARQTQPIQQIA